MISVRIFRRPAAWERAGPGPARHIFNLQYLILITTTVILYKIQYIVLTIQVITSHFLLRAPAGWGRLQVKLGYGARAGSSSKTTNGNKVK